MYINVGLDLCQFESSILLGHYGARCHRQSKCRGTVFSATKSLENAKQNKKAESDKVFVLEQQMKFFIRRFAPKNFLIKATEF